MLFFNQVVFGSMWYIPMIICLYMLIPFINIVLQKNTSNVILLPVTVVIVSSMLIPSVISVLSTTGIQLQINFALSSGNLFSYFLVFVLCGYAVSNGALKRISTALLIIITALSFILLFSFQFWEYSTPGDTKVSYNFILLAVCSLFFFATLQRLVSNDSQNQFITYIARISFAIYLSHIFIVDLLVVLFSRFFLPIPKFFLLEIIPLSGSILFIRLFSRINFFKKYVFLIKD